MDEATLLKKLRAIEALHAGATTDGEKDAAERARQRICMRLEGLRTSDPPMEFHFTCSDTWRKKALMALLRRYGIEPYRYVGQRYTTVMAMVSKTFVDETLWPEYEQVSEALEKYLDETTERVVAEVLHADGGDAVVIDKPKQLAVKL